MATNPIGNGTKTIGINMSAEMAKELTKRADSMHLSVSKYCKIILQQWLDSGEKLNLTER
jgi:cyclopropane fatty-acyl-phospholipid synthase-like methyltransferase